MKATFVQSRSWRMIWRIMLACVLLPGLLGNVPAAPEGAPVSAAGEDLFTLDWSSSLKENTQAVAWGDYDGDGDLDLAENGNEVVQQFARRDCQRSGYHPRLRARLGGGGMEGMASFSLGGGAALGPGCPPLGARRSGQQPGRWGGAVRG